MSWQQSATRAVFLLGSLIASPRLMANTSVQGGGLPQSVVGGGAASRERPGPWCVHRMDRGERSMTVTCRICGQTFETTKAPEDPAILEHPGCQPGSLEPGDQSDLRALVARSRAGAPSSPRDESGLDVPAERASGDPPRGAAAPRAAGARPGRNPSPPAPRRAPGDRAGHRWRRARRPAGESAHPAGARAEDRARPGGHPRLRDLLDPARLAGRDRRPCTATLAHAFVPLAREPLAHAGDAAGTRELGHPGPRHGGPLRRHLPRPSRPSLMEAITQAVRSRPLTLPLRTRSELAP